MLDTLKYIKKVVELRLPLPSTLNIEHHNQVLETIRNSPEKEIYIEFLKLLERDILDNSTVGRLEKSEIAYAKQLIESEMENNPQKIKFEDLSLRLYSLKDKGQQDVLLRKSDLKSPSNFYIRNAENVLRFNANQKKCKSVAIDLIKKSQVAMDNLNENLVDVYEKA